MHECGDCSMCCKLSRIQTPELSKPANTWCSHCTPGKGCQIYDTRPSVCRQFLCIWKGSEKLPMRFKPNKLKMYMFELPDRDRILVAMVDPAFPLAWKTGDGRFMISAFTKKGFHVFVCVGEARHFLKGDGRPIPDTVTGLKEHGDEYKMTEEADGTYILERSKE